MTGYTVHTGSTEQFTEGWDRIFSGNQRKKSAGSSKKRSTKTKTAQGKAAKKGPAKAKKKKKVAKRGR